MTTHSTNHENQSARPHTPQSPRSASPSPHRWLGRSSLVERMGTSNFLVMAHACPPAGSDASRLIEQYAPLRDIIDAVYISDNPKAQPTLSALATAALFERNGIPTILTLNCRDRNLIALQSDLLGASALGIQGVFCVSGDRRVLGDHPEAKPVYDVDSLQLIALASQLRDEGVFMSGRRLTSLPTYLIGASGSLFKEPLTEQVDRTAAKIALGADIIITPPLYDIKLFSDFATRLYDTGRLEQARLIAGIPLLVSHTDGLTFAASMINRVKQLPGCSGALLFPSDPHAVDAVTGLLEMTNLVQPPARLKINIRFKAAIRA